MLFVMSITFTIIKINNKTKCTETNIEINLFELKRSFQIYERYITRLPPKSCQIQFCNE